MKKELKKIVELGRVSRKCSRCAETFMAQGNQGYCKTCYSEYKKEWSNKRKSYYLYIIQDENDKVLYVGATEQLKSRMYHHLSGYSNISELIKSNKWHCIKTLNINDIIENREELYLAENSLIELYEPQYNKKLNIIRKVDKLREFIILSEIHDTTMEWTTYCYRKQHEENKEMLI